jgi:DNA-binding MarR family transcriptional regulator
VEADKDDHRAKNLFLTEKEQTKFRAMKEHRKLMEETLFKGFSAEEKEQLLAYLERVYENL